MHSHPFPSHPATEMQGLVINVLRGVLRQEDCPEVQGGSHALDLEEPTAGPPFSFLEKNCAPTKTMSLVEEGRRLANIVADDPRLKKAAIHNLCNKTIRGGTMWSGCDGALLSHDVSGAAQPTLSIVFNFS